MNSEKASNRPLAGKCLCGTVHYAVADAFLYAANCHCSNCRRTTGSAFKPFAGIERDKVRVTSGADRSRAYVTSTVVIQGGRVRRTLQCDS